jgi:hypothetical protein
MFLVAASGSMALAAFACSLNPQPLPPEQAGDAGTVGSSLDAGPNHEGGFGGEAGLPAADAGLDSTPTLGDAEAGGGEEGGSEAGPDSSTDGPSEEGSLDAGDVEASM